MDGPKLEDESKRTTQISGLLKSDHERNLSSGRLLGRFLETVFWLFTNWLLTGSGRLRDGGRKKRLDCNGLLPERADAITFSKMKYQGKYLNRSPIRRYFICPEHIKYLLSPSKVSSQKEVDVVLSFANG